MSERRFNHAFQAPQGEYIGQHHETIDQVSDAPHIFHWKDGAYIDHNNIYYVIEAGAFGIKQVFRSFFSQIAPADQGGNGEGDQEQC